MMHRLSYAAALHLKVIIYFTLLPYQVLIQTETQVAADSLLAWCIQNKLHCLYTLNPRPGKDNWNPAITGTTSLYSTSELRLLAVVAQVTSQRCPLLSLREDTSRASITPSGHMDGHL
jgi:hypothetical protein